MTASQAAGTAVDGLKVDPLVQTITQVIVSAKKVTSGAYNWAFGDDNASALAKQDLWTNMIHYANGLMGLGLLRGVRPTNFFRGARPGTTPSFTPRPGDYKVDPVTGYVKDTHGVSIFDNAGRVSSKGFEPHQVDLNSMPDTLRIIQRFKRRFRRSLHTPLCGTPSRVVSIPLWSPRPSNDASSDG